MSKVKKSDTDQRQFWQMVLDTFKSSGLSVRQFCKQEGLTEASFYSWRKRLSDSQKPSPSKGLSQPDPFIQVSMPTSKPIILELTLASGHKLHIPSDIDPAFLTGVLSAMKQAKLC
jgi:hypothetical protein